MKLNWGSGIAIFLTLFIGFILTLVVKAHQTESDLYAEDYYDQEVNYQQTIDSKSRGNFYSDQFTLSITNNGEVLVGHPEWIKQKENAKIVFYRANNAALDRVFSFSNAQNGVMVLNRTHFENGQYDVRIEWVNDGKEFQVDKQINLD